MTSVALDSLVLGGLPLTLDSLVAATRNRERTVAIDASVAGRLTANAELAARVAERNRLYGRSTGVGANRHVAADDSDGLHGRRLLRSHAAGAGELLPDEIGRATVLIRANQLAAARSGIAPIVPAALVEAVNRGLSPVVRSYGGLGTGDITVLAELGLSLLGERPWSDGSICALIDDIDVSGGLPLMSSSAPTLAVAALAVHDVRLLAEAMIAVAALGAYAVRANPEAWSEVGASSRPHAGMIEVGRSMRSLIDTRAYEPGRLQDPFGWRCFVSVHGALMDVIAQVEHALAIDINASAENPLYVDGASWHHGGFHHAGLALGMDQLRLALVQAGGLSLSRLTKINDPSMTGLRPFLADGPDGSSGTMVLEYTAASALAELRQHAGPTTLGQSVISLGLEDHDSFAWQGALSLRSSLAAMRTVVGCELVAALRAVRQHGASLTSERVDALLVAGAGVADVGPDHSLIDDIAAAIDLLPAFAAIR